MILSNKKCYPSCKILRDEIQKISGIKLMITNNPEIISKKNKKLHLRYGNSLPFNGKDTLYNRAEAIRISANKRLFEEKAKEHNVFVPKLIKFNRTFPDKKDFPIIVRKRISGKAGEGIMGIFEDIDSLPENYTFYWWAKFYRLSWELRVHVFEGIIIKAFSKKLLSDTKYPIRLNKNTHFSLIDHKKDFNSGKYENLIKKVDTIAKDILRAGFFVLDVGWCPEIKDYLFLESGTAPGLNENSAKLYAKKLVERIF